MFDAGCFCGVGLAPECCSFSRAVNPPVGSRQERWGLCNISFNMQEKVSRGNQRSSFCFASVSRGVHLNLCYWLENLDGNYLWLMPDWLNSGLLFEKSCRFDQCLQSHLEKARADTHELLPGICAQVDNERQQPRGRSALHSCCWTKAAQIYPTLFCTALNLARAVGFGAGLKVLGKRRRVSAASCAKCNERVGEAAHPGPRRCEPPVLRDPCTLVNAAVVEPGIGQNCGATSRHGYIASSLLLPLVRFSFVRHWQFSC